jgi:hypothetical protein
MADFSSGVSGYIKGRTIIEVNFPIDLKGKATVSCAQCPYYNRYDRKCRLNDSMTAFPDAYIGQNCPLTFENEEENENG